MTSFDAPIAARIWQMKYRLSAPDGTPIEGSVEQSWTRVARALAAVEPDPAAWEGAFYAALAGFRFLPAGRILAGSGTGRRVTLFNCFVMGTIDDSLPGIFDALKEAALTMQQGGGIGYDFSTLRPKGAPVQGVAADASGPLSFMDVWDSMCRTIMSAGARRGAMMATMRCDHPDIEDFITAKQDPARLRNFNLSVLVTDAFMTAVDAGAPWPLTFGGRVFRTLPARDLWQRIMRATYDYAEPGVIFIDRINAMNNLAYVEEIASTNPCGEQPLPPYGACLLGSINLARLVRAPFTDTAAIDMTELDGLVRVAVRMMDNTIDASEFPLPAQAAEAALKRRIGLGVTGLADALMMLGLRYDSPAAVQQAGDWMHAIACAAYLGSAGLAAEKGAFPLYDRDAFLASGFMAAMDEDVRAAVARDGIRNGLLTSVAPTGTISLFAGNASSGIEPVFAASYARRVLQSDGTRTEEEVVDYAVATWRALGHDGLPPAFVDAQTLQPQAHVAMQAAGQRWVDSAISKTINLPADISFPAFESVYRAAYDAGCKGCTTYRPNAVTGAVLAVSDPQPDPQPVPRLAAPTTAALPVRPKALPGATYKLKWPGSPHAIYITVNDIIEDGRQRPFEVFINSKNMEHYAWTVALTRMISAVFRRGGDVGFVVDELKAVFDPRGGAWLGGQYVPSILAAIGGTLEGHMQATGFLPPAALTMADPQSGPLQAGPPGPVCPACGTPGMRMVEGCLLCPTCGESRCG